MRGSALNWRTIPISVTADGRSMTVSISDTGLIRYETHTPGPGAHPHTMYRYAWGFDMTGKRYKSESAALAVRGSK